MTAVASAPDRATLTPEEDATHAVAEAQRLAAIFATRAAAHDRDGSFPFENYQDLFEAGLIGATMPRERGGHGFGLETTMRIIETIGYGDPSTALVLSMTYLQHRGLAAANKWPAHIYDQLCRETLERPTLINSARVEPELGTPARGGLPATTATRTENGWRLAGRKVYTTGSPILRYAVVWAKTDEDPVRVGTFLLPMDTPGATIEHTWDHFGMRATGSHDLLLENAEIPADHAVDVREPDAWQTPDPSAGQANALVVSCVYNGVAKAARDWLVTYLQERAPTNLGASLSTLPRFQMAVGEIDSLLYTNERLLFGLARDIDAGLPVGGADPGFAKVTATNNAVAAVKKAVELVGNPGLFKSNPLERHYRDVTCGPVHTPQDDTVLTNAGKLAFKNRPVRPSSE